MHDYDAQRSRTHYEEQARALAIHVQNLRRSGQVLRRLQRTAHETAIYAWVHDRDAGLARARMALSAHAGLQILRFAQADKGDTTITLPGYGEVPLRNDLGLVDADAGVWLNAWLSGQIALDAEVLDAIVEQPLEILRQPVADALEYMYALIGALHAFTLRGLVDQAGLARAMIASDPAKLPKSQRPESERVPANDAVDHALYVATPIIELMHHLGLRDAAAFEATARKHLGNHGRYWSQPGRCLEPSGLIAWPILAIVAAARRVGVDVHIDDDYLPMAILES